MKSGLVFVGLVALFVLVKGDDVKEKFKKAFDKCREKHTISDDDFEKLKKKDIDHPYTKESKCLLACVFEEGKLLQNGKYNKENALVLADVFHKEKPEESNKAKEVIETCAKENPEVGTDQCEFAYKMSICCAKEAKKIGLENMEYF